MGRYVVQTQFVDTFGVFHREQKEVEVSYYETLPEHDQKNFYVYGKRRPWQYVVTDNERLSKPKHTEEKSENEIWADKQRARRKKEEEENTTQNPFGGSFGSFGSFGSGGSFGGGSFGGGGAGGDW